MFWTRSGVVTRYLRHPAASALPLVHPELAGVAFVAASVQIYRYPRAAHFLSPIFTQVRVDPSSLPAAPESQASRCLLQGLVGKDGQ